MATGALKLIETTISEASVRMRLANDADPAKATAWVELQVPLSSLVLDNNNPVGNPQRRHLGAVQIAALRRAQDGLDEAIQAISAALPR